MLIMLAMVAVMFQGTMTAKAESVSSYVTVTDNKAKIIDITPGEVTHVKLPIRSNKEYIMDPVFMLKADSKNPFTADNFKLTTATNKDNVAGINNYETTYLEFDLTVKDSAAINNYNFVINCMFTDYTFDIDTGKTTTDRTEPIELIARVTKEKAPSQLTISDIKYDEDSAAIGNTFDLSFTVKNEGEISALNTYLKLDYGTSGMVPGYTVESIKIGDLKAGETKKMKLAVKVLPTAEEGYKTLTAAFSYKDSEGGSGDSKTNLYVQVKKVSTGTSEDAKLSIASSTVNDQVLAGASYNLTGVLTNLGQKKATNVKVTISDGIGTATGLIPKYEGDSVSVASIDAGKTAKFSLPIVVSDTAAGGLREITLSVSYTDSENVSKTAVVKAYITVIAKTVEETTSEVVITNAAQSPSSPRVGEKVTVTFDIENRGNKAVSAVSVGGRELSSAGFEPFTAQADKEVGTIEAGAKKTVSLEFKVGPDIAEGLNTLKLGCNFTDVSGKKQSNETSIYILDVINDSNSKPRVIVSDFTIDSEELKAGSTFNFTFFLKNTHVSKAAKNIKVSITQADNVFSASQGTNSFYIDKISAGETVEQTLEMKVKSDVATGAYELEIKVEYEYDDMSKLDLEAGGVTETSKVKLQAVENLRPSVQNFTVGMYGDTPFVNESSSMSFDFINMGKSSLNNVRFSLEGDFTLDSGATFFYGTIAAGSSDYVEMSVTPQKSGDCSGVMHIIMENSNGDEITIDHPFDGIYVGEISMPSDMNGGFEDPSMPAYDDMTGENTKKDIMPVWLFIIIQVVIFAAVIPVTRIIIINSKKKKLRNSEDDL